jgi:hypothetical protein
MSTLTKSENLQRVAEKLDKLDILLANGEEAARQAIIQTLYKELDKKTKRSREIRLSELGCITGWSMSKLDRQLRSSKKRVELYGKQIPVEDSTEGKGNRTDIQCYDLAEFDKWLQKAAPATWKKVQALRTGAPLKPTNPAQIKTIAEATSVPLVITLEYDSTQISSMAPSLAALLQAIQTGKTLGLVTLADAMTKYQWSSTTRRERVRKIWLRLLESERKRIEQFRELDRLQVIKTERATLATTLPPARSKGKDRRPPL